MSKITHITPSYFPKIGGVEKHAEEISRLMLGKKWEVSVVTQKHKKNLEETELVNKVKVFRIPTKDIQRKFKHKISVWKWVWQNRQVFVDSDIVHVHDVFWWILPIWPLIRTKVFITFHGWEGKFPVPIKNKLQRLLWAKMSLGRIHVGKYISEFYWDKPDEVIYGGTSPITSRHAGLDSLSISGEGYKEKIFVVFLGRLEKVNAVDEYIKIIINLKKLGFKLNVTWVGDGSLKNKCKKIGKVLGFVKNPNKYIAKADIVFASSYLSVLEAQSLGKIVVALYSNKLKQSYLENYPGRKYMMIFDNDSMHRKLADLLKNQEKMLKIQKAANKFASKMTWKKVLEKYENIYSNNLAK